MQSINCEIDSKTLQCKLCGYKFKNANVKRNCPSKRDPDNIHDIKNRFNITHIDADNLISDGNKEEIKVKPIKFLDKVKNFSVAAIGHALRGNPTCTQEQIDERHAICLQCERYRKHIDRDGKETEVGYCESCGCNINKAQKYMNKLAWADQKCPEGKWLEIIDKTII